MRKGTGPSTVADYLEQCPPAHRRTLRELRAVVRVAAPGATEALSYGIICYHLRYMLVGMGAAREFCSFHVMSTALVRRMRADFRGAEVAGATLHFPPGKPLPRVLVRKIVLARVAENEARAAAGKR